MQAAFAIRSLGSRDPRMPEMFCEDTCMLIKWIMLLSWQVGAHPSRDPKNHVWSENVFSIVVFDAIQLHGEDG